jgi:putative alpha-1,2-mannosidase
LVGAHDTNRVRRGGRSRGSARRAGLWVTHNLAALVALTGGRA